MVDAPALPIAEPEGPTEALRRAQQGKGYWRRVWGRLRRDKVTLAMGAVLALLLVMVIFAPYFTVHDPYEGSVLRRLKPVGYPSHWLGTDVVGRCCVVADGVRREGVAIGGGCAGCSGAVDRRIFGHAGGLYRRARQ